jgi:endonuclease-3
MKSAAATRRVVETLAEQHPNADTELHYRNPFELLVATMLSAQSTDQRVNMVTPALFKRYPDPLAMAQASVPEHEKLILSTGFFRQKSKALIGMSQKLLVEHGSLVPADMEKLTALPGVGRKTANVVLGNAFDRNEGVVVDTHVARLSQRLGFTRHTDPVKIEQDLMRLFPSERWTMLAHLLIEHGRRICVARKPKCESCFLNDVCPSSRV